MADDKKNVEESINSGVQNRELPKWDDFLDYVKGLTHLSGLIFRGQARDDWKLEPSLNRLLPEGDVINNATARHEHMQRFRQAIRGRRGPNPQEIVDDNELWAIGQHNGLATPLLDWTESPFVALYFAFLDETPDKNPYRVVYALSMPIIEDVSNLLMTEYEKRKGTPDGYTEYEVPPVVAEVSRLLGGDNKSNKITMPTPPPDTVKIVRPLSDDNRNLVNQRGLFTLGPNTMTLDAWVKETFQGKNADALWIFRIKDFHREACLSYLNRMNINHLSLFPDLHGASEFCNMSLRIDNY